MNLAKLLPSQSLAKAGVWRTFAPPTEPTETFEVKITYNLTSYREEATRQFASARRELDGQPLGLALSEEITTRAMIGTLLVDWRGLQQDGKNVPFDKEVAFQVLRGYPALEIFVRESAADVRLFQEKPANERGQPEGAAPSQAGDLKSGDPVGADHGA